MRVFSSLMAVAWVLIVTQASSAQLAEKKALTLAAAKKGLAAAEAEAKRLGAPGGAIAIVDDGGHLLAMERLDNTIPASASVSVGKARTAAVFRRPTRVLEEMINKGRTSLTAVADITPLQGGLPILIDGQVVGAIGVSGAASAPQDEEIAAAGVKAIEALQGAADGTPYFQPSPMPITQIDQRDVAAAFAKGMPLLEADDVKVAAARRDKPGIPEVHERELDVFYIVEGSAAFVTGGKVVDAKLTEPGQIRGTIIEGGETRRLAKGDVIVIPTGIPHWFKEVDAPLLYFVVKAIK